MQTLTIGNTKETQIDIKTERTESFRSSRVRAETRSMPPPNWILPISQPEWPHHSVHSALSNDIAVVIIYELYDPRDGIDLENVRSCDRCGTRRHLRAAVANDDVISCPAARSIR